MSRVPSRAVRCLAAVLLMTFASGASAQQAQPRPAPAPQTTAPAPQPGPQAETPQRTTATYDDWVVECESLAGPPPQKGCDMAQITQVQGKNLPFSRVAVMHPVKGEPTKLIVQLPVNASFRTNVRIQVSDSDAGMVAPFARCVPTGCFAEFELRDDLLKKLRAASGIGKLSFADAGGHDVSVPLSFKGFNQAFEALARD